MVLSNGVVSAQRAGATVADFDDKVEHVQSAVQKWHEKYVNQFSVDLALSQRRKTGINKLVSQPFTRIKAQLAFQTVSPEFVKQVKSECKVQNPVLPETAGYSQPVELLINNGHVYYKAPINNAERVQADKLTTG